MGDEFELLEIIICDNCNDVGTISKDEFGFVITKCECVLNEIT